LIKAEKDKGKKEILLEEFGDFYLIKEYFEKAREKYEESLSFGGKRN
jgi:hypothetical protein